MSLANSRDQRSTAGSRMSKLLDAEEEDEFYKTTYGGFNDESGDDEYRGDHSDTEDEVDSDFDIDEGDEPDSDQEADAPRRKSRVVTKAYKEPLKVSKPKVKRVSEEVKAERPKPERRPIHELQDFEEIRKSVRKSTSEHTRKTNQRLQERQQEAPRKRKGTLNEHVLTQDELLAEAKLTAEINVRSLENYERLEADKKKHVHKKRKFEGPTIRYHSVLMPLLPDTLTKEENVDVEGLDQDTPQPTPTSSSSVQGAGSLCSRTYITFSDDDAFNSAFPASARVTPSHPVQEVCPVTHKPALYRDPVTDIPYANARAFRIIREAYQKYITAHGFPNASGNFSGNNDTDSPAASAAKSARPKLTIKQGVIAT
ncbi:vacuolar protein sorting 72 homolog a isoform X2 [Triplophysa rosa]|uniref:Vacuolar protein sorting-associated protein 72 homolog n=1 Tax=Triplophysa rosa TaxID=992332 RepID=A0A9W7WGX4_TRIRA|nr:vacuolar protein sorting 72 homolog a isoform X2 [Triplophysa rosa]KAI7798690.1 vacuolar protein sorting-associated protein 72-like protein [Triplophysa rosa]